MNHDRARRHAKLGGVAAHNVRQALELFPRGQQALVAAHPELREQIFEADNTLRRWVNVYVDGADARHLGGLETPTRDGIEVVILPAMAGGAAAPDGE